MATLEALIHTKQLKMGYLQELGQSKQHQPIVKYDRDVDTFLVFFNPNDQEIVAHYVDDNVALLYIADTFEIVGLQIEDFSQDFLPAHEKVARLWQLRETGEEIGDVGDILIFAQKRLPKVAKEVTEAAKEVLGEPGEELAAAFG